MNTVHEIQRQIDLDGVYEIPAAPGVTSINQPIFLNSTPQSVGRVPDPGEPANRPVRLSAAPGAFIDAYYAGPAVTTYPRGLISDAHWTADGWRTRGDSFLSTHGTQWDCGELYPAQTRWESVTKLEFGWKGKLHAAVAGGVGWDNVALMGCQSNELGSWADSPDPWMMVCEAGKVYLIVRTADGVIRRWSVSQPTPAGADMDVAFVLDLTTGVCTATLAGTAAPVDSSGAGTGFTAATRLRENTGGGFGIAAIPSSGMTMWKWADLRNWPDLTVNRCYVRFADEAVGQFHCDFLGTRARQQTYTGGPSLPLCSIDRGGIWMWAVHRSQFTDGLRASQDVVISELSGQGHFQAPVIYLAECYGKNGVLIENCRFDRGSRGVQSAGFQNWNVKVRDCYFSAPTDRGYDLFRANFDLDTARSDYAAAGWLRLRDSFGVVRGSTLNSVPGFPGAPHYAEQYGGQVRWVDQNGNYEFSPCPPFLELHPGIDNVFTTGVYLSNCRTTVDANVPLVTISARPAGYTAPVLVTTDSLWTTLEKAEVAAGVNPVMRGFTWVDPATGRVNTASQLPPDPETTAKDVARVFDEFLNPPPPPP